MILFFSSLIAPIFVGITLATYKYWLEHRSDKKLK
ncbi:type I toxin-antitoxin system Fst family toxin [Listeria cossartiae subsp. cayugensis]|nr:type I toxin-antitoxin system Fst family toxin [Listeria cossartiae]MDT0002105.1 type I toxin-antitoxin system Fst family toxin [Listeria cossartiae subsp. cayugensis]MDT0019526.1 type I toxin-antitoxin system Fst family toxin [Listeria cossartiae subsp. cayugensis]MDT0034900.1 type I toxin-antitoxin system Fst family toxin [Listeria cossartiae subsp. cayugensis]MDT0041277.1 type I toxin-antitoxin system Fst family toxin [Listeria cossartiae subsp. cayugensis]MDT0045602.1 type I toxin-antit